MATPYLQSSMGECRNRKFCTRYGVPRLHPDSSRFFGWTVVSRSLHFVRRSRKGSFSNRQGSMTIQGWTVPVLSCKVQSRPAGMHGWLPVAAKETAASVTVFFAFPCNVIKGLTERSRPSHSGPHGKTERCVSNPFAATCRIVAVSVQT